MSQFNPAKLHTRFHPGIDPTSFTLPRRYTLTHSDSNGDLFLTIGKECERKQISGWYTRLMRDEVLAEWKAARFPPELHVYCHVSGGLVIGFAGWRYNIFVTHLPQVLQAFRYGENQLVRVHPEIDKAPVTIHFIASNHKYKKTVNQGRLEDYALPIRT